MTEGAVGRLDIDVEARNTELEKKSAEEIVRWAVETFRPRIALTTSFGSGSAVLLHMVAQADRSTPVLFLETGFHFKETLAYKDELAGLLKLNVRELKRDLSPEAFFGKLGPKPYEKNPDECCRINKVEPFKKALADFDAWISGIRRSQAHTREHIRVVESYEEGLIKVNPLAAWNSKQVHEYMKQHNLPQHPLFAKGYLSIGCEPCTRAVLSGENERSGRWANLEKTECGIHTFMKPAPADASGSAKTKASKES